VGAIIAAMSSREAAQLWPARQAETTVGRADASTVVTPYPGEVEKRRLNILLAEDNRVNQLLAAGVIENDGHRVVVANNGREALEKLAEERFDLVLMDVQMPEMDGFEATAVIRGKEKESGGHLPIIALTAHAMKGDRERCLDAGMDAYVAKPIKARVLLETIRATCQSMCPVV
jgi:CheY-like chemotaxis protein